MIYSHLLDFAILQFSRINILHRKSILRISPSVMGQFDIVFDIAYLISKVGS